MKTIFVVLSTLLVTLVLIASADEEKGHEEDKRMIYWKRSGLENLEDEDLDFTPYPLRFRNRFARPAYLRKRMIYW
ncbi:unnamed protein product [Hymenolepis diminuta]|uniref:Uncharacterized protein n=1 Tax=Hymenolepis diminuta TaxID=6216 RepID=A0A564YKL3_HYMDI|nr:unnamed protein product [Hymenolepis diminuta]